MLMNASGTGPFVMHGRDVLDIHIWAPSMNAAYREQVTDESSGEQSNVLTLISPTDGPLTPAFDANEIGNSLDWGGVWDTPMSFVYEIGHSDLYGAHPGAFCLPGQPFCGSFNRANWAGQQPLRIFDVTFGDGSHPRNWAVVSDTGGKAEVLGNSFVGPTHCAGYGGPYCIYPWFSWDGQAFNYGVDYPNTVRRLRHGEAVRAEAPVPRGRDLRRQDLLRHDHPVARTAVTDAVPPGNEVRAAVSMPIRSRAPTCLRAPTRSTETVSRRTTAA